MGSPKSFRILTSRSTMLSLLSIQAFVIFVLVGTILVSLQDTFKPQATGTASPVPATATLFPTQIPTSTPQPSTSIQAEPVQAEPVQVLLSDDISGWMVLSMNDGGYAHLFAYQPEGLPFTRLTNHPWDDITPAISPDGTRIVYSSRQNGYWDLYLLDIHTGEQTRLTDTLEFDASPAWSPDGAWIAYETYTGDNLEIFLLSVTDPSQGSLRLTEDPASDRSPAWSPDGRQIAFVSDRSGEDEIWLADLDDSGNRFTDLSRDATNPQDHPVWSPDGTSLAWVVDDGHFTYIENHNLTNTDLVFRVGDGGWPLWDANGSMIASLIEEPNRTYLSAYSADGAVLIIPAEALPGSVHGWDWTGSEFPTSLPSNINLAAQTTATPPWADISPEPLENNSSRRQLVALDGVSAPQPYLIDAVAASFQSLRQRIQEEAGWDFLSTLDEAYVPVTDAMAPGYDGDWAYAGRSFAFSTATLTTGWTVLSQEYSGETLYWRVYVRALAQDGSEGSPLTGRIWDLNARYGDDPAVYDQGGELSASVPSGYWVDLTDLASRYGWEREPALSNWRTYFQGTRFNRFIHTGGLDWETAMLDLYPPEALVTPTPVIPPTFTPTRAPTWYKTPTPTPTATATLSATSRPTWTPIP